MRGHPIDNTVDVVRRSRIGMLRSASVVDAEHSPPGDVGKASRVGVVRLEVAKDEAAAVEVDHQWRSLCGAVQPARDPVGIDVQDRRDRVSRLK